MAAEEALDAITRTGGAINPYNEVYQGVCVCVCVGLLRGC